MTNIAAAQSPDGLRHHCLATNAMWVWTFGGPFGKAANLDFAAHLGNHATRMRSDRL